MTVFLDGVAAQFYRGIGPETQFIGPFSQMNFFIGANNAGKSIALNLLVDRLRTLVIEDQRKDLAVEEQYRGEITGQPAFAWGVRRRRLADLIGQQIGEFCAENVQFDRGTLTKIADEILDGLCKKNVAWFSKDNNGSVVNFPSIQAEDAQHWTAHWQLIWRVLTDHTGGSLLHIWVAHTLSHIARLALPGLPRIHLLPAKRRLGSTGETLTDLSGPGLMDHLATLQQPQFDRQEDRQRFKLINDFVREITGKPDALLEVPHDRKYLHVHMDNKVLPLHALGTGIHEIILIAAFCTIYDGSIMCIEEPEIHLHPLLQRKLVNYLVKNTSSQYFIATHSSAFIDTPNSSIFHVSNDGVQTFINPVLTKNEQRSILNDLGCHASDILQANAVIWVEGPSDRIYLNHWIKTVDPRLQEGIHYTIMFYGGGLISHLTASDEALDQFIKLRDLNRNMAIVIDSDRASASDDLKPHAQRLFAEMGKGDGVAWVTEGREIENYVDGAKLQAALKQLHPTLYKKAGVTGQYDHAFHFWRGSPDKEGKNVNFKDANKVGAADLICRSEADLGILDLRDRVTKLVQMIQKANGLLNHSD